VSDDIAAPLPDLSWKDLSIITVDTGDSAAHITRMTIHLAQNVPDDLLAGAVVAPLFAYTEVA
jgi:hypothetical protein